MNLEREMKTRRPERGLRAGSSLIEVLIAMGVLAVVLPLVFAVLARAGQSCAASQAETRCVAILPFCMNEIEAAQQGNACFLPPLTRGVTIPATGACLALAFTKDGRAIGCVEPKTYRAGVHQLANEPIRFLASFHTEPAPTRPNIPAMLTLRITLEYPAAVPLEMRRHLDFFTCIP